MIAYADGEQPRQVDTTAEVFQVLRELASFLKKQDIERKPRI